MGASRWTGIDYNARHQKDLPPTTETANIKSHRSSEQLTVLDTGLLCQVDCVDRLAPAMSEATAEDAFYYPKGSKYHYGIYL